MAASSFSHGSEIVGVVYFVPPETFLNDIVSSIKVSKNSRAYMINKNGDTIADVTLDTPMTLPRWKPCMEARSSMMARLVSTGVSGSASWAMQPVSMATFL